MCSSGQVGYCDDDEDKHPDDWHCICIPCDDHANDDSGDNSDDDEEMEAEKQRCKYNRSICVVKHCEEIEREETCMCKTK